MYLKVRLEIEKIKTIKDIEAAKIALKERIAEANDEKSNILSLPVDRCLFSPVNTDQTPCVKTDCTKHLNWRQIRIAQVGLFSNIKKADLTIFSSVQSYRTIRMQRLRLLKEIKDSRDRVKKLLGIEKEAIKLC
jgi:hypothetical protein